MFIVGQHRTGSTLLKNILNAHSEITMAHDEMNLYEPFRNNTLERLVDNDSLTAEEVTGLIANKKIYGTFWQEFAKSGISLESLRKKLQDKEVIKSQSMIQSVLELIVEQSDSRYSGVKYPVQVSKVSYIAKHFPEAKVIFLSRHPAAIIASKINDEATQKRKEKSWLHRFSIHYSTLLYFIIEYRISVDTYFKNSNNLYLVLYEELVTDKQKTVHSLCAWLGISFEEGMLQVSGKSSSHNVKESGSVYRASLERYKEVLNSFDRFIIRLFTSNHLKRIQRASGFNL